LLARAVGLGVTTVVEGAAGALAVGLAVALAVVVAVGLVGVAGTVTCEAADGVTARAIEATSAAEMTGNATLACTRMRRAGPLLMRFTGNSLGWLLLAMFFWKNSGRSGRPDHPKSASS
jgi:hypothetical protein